MVLTRRAAKKQLEEEEEAKKETVVVGCQDAKIAEHDDAENREPHKQKRAGKAKATVAKHISLAPNENQQNPGVTKEGMKQGSPTRASEMPPPLPAIAVVASPPVVSLISTKTSPVDVEQNDHVADSWEDIVVPEEPIDEEKLALEAPIDNQAIIESTTTAATPIPAFISALAANSTVESKEINTIINPIYCGLESKDIVQEDKETKTAADSPSSSSPLVAAINTTFPAQENNTENDDAKTEQESGKKLNNNKKQKHSKEKGFSTLHNTRKDHGVNTKYKAPTPHLQDIIHPAPAALVEAVQMSADSLQAQLDALSFGGGCGPSTSRGSFNRQLPSSSTVSSLGTPYFQRNPETTASVANHLAALSSQLHRLTLCVGTLQQEIAAAATPNIPDVVGRKFLVLDTCALMHRNPTLPALVEALIRQNNSNNNNTTRNRISVLVPLEIVRELDGLKDSRDEKRRSGARKAISILSELQRASNSQTHTNTNDVDVFRLYRGQRQHELLGLQARRGDDGILDCMLLFKNAGADEITLVTQDNNFALRAQTEGFKAMTVAQALDFVINMNGGSSSSESAKPRYLTVAAATAVNAPALGSTTPARKVIQLPPSSFEANNNGVPPPPPPPPSVPRPAIVAPKQQEEKKTASDVAPLPSPPPPLPLSFSLPLASSKQEKQEIQQENKTPDTKQQQQNPPCSPSQTFKIPIIWTPLPPPPPCQSVTDAPPEAPQTVSGAIAAKVLTAPPATPATFTKWQTFNGKLVRPPGSTTKQWRNYKSNYHHKLKKQAQRAASSQITRD
jgi:rRNA-processing protein FCF1